MQQLQVKKNLLQCVHHFPFLLSVVYVYLLRLELRYKLSLSTGPIEDLSLFFFPPPSCCIRAHNWVSFSIHTLMWVNYSIHCQYLFQYCPVFKIIFQYRVVTRTDATKKPFSLFIFTVVNYVEILLPDLILQGILLQFFSK